MMKLSGLRLAILLSCVLVQTAYTQDRPNVIVIMTDDQGIGDFGCMGNPLVQTPNIDSMFQRSVHFSNFYVSPVCSPTRASLMTGRYAYRTRVVDTFIGRAMMDPDEVTLAERMNEAGYATGIFGKWHLGDCYPLRPMDQGFNHSVVHRGGGIGQSSDPPGAEGAYTNPILYQNGEPRRERGYCTDVYYDHALEFIEQCKSRELPFFVYLPDNCPHGPFKDVPKDWWEKYKDANLTHDRYPTVEGGNGVSDKTNPDKNARVYAMISNIDENIGRLQDHLKKLDLFENTIIVFLTDNGPNGHRFVQGLRGQKTSVYEGGIKTLCMMQWPAKIQAHRTLPELAAHIDLSPTLLDACGIESKSNPKIDGVSLMPLIEGEAKDWEQTRNPVFIQVHRGNQPQRYHQMAVRDHRWKLVHPSGFHRERFQGPPAFELYDLQSDPFEKNNLAAKEPGRVKELVSLYDRWFDDVSQTREDNYQCPEIVIDPTRERTLILTRQDARRKTGQTDWGKSLHWILRSEYEINASIACRFKNAVIEGDVSLWIGDQRFTTQVDPDSQLILFDRIPIPADSFEFKVNAVDAQGKIVAAHQVYLSGQIKK